MSITKTLSENKLMATLMAAAVIAGVGWLAAHVETPWKLNGEKIEENVVHLDIHDEKFSEVGLAAKGIVETLDKISARQELFVQYVTTIDARAQVMVGSGVSINRRGPLDKYLIFASRMELTNRDHEDQPSLVVEVGEETFANNDKGIVVKVGRDIATRLEVPIDQWFFRVSVRRTE